MASIRAWLLLVISTALAYGVLIAAIWQDAGTVNRALEALDFVPGTLRGAGVPPTYMVFVNLFLGSMTILVLLATAASRFTLALLLGGHAGGNRVVSAVSATTTYIAAVVLGYTILVLVAVWHPATLNAVIEWAKDIPKTLQLPHNWRLWARLLAEGPLTTLVFIVAARGVISFTRMLFRRGEDE
ncbi:MAG: hypothetical protein AAB421_03695 [Patescibacteria group bacterium]